jgi:hypothetical protein
MKAALAFALAALLVCLTSVGSGQAQPAAAPTPTTRILAIGTVNPGVDPADYCASCTIFLHHKRRNVLMVVSGKQIRAARALLGWTRSELARAAGLHRARNAAKDSHQRGEPAMGERDPGQTGYGPEFGLTRSRGGKGLCGRSRGITPRRASTSGRA